MELSIVKKERRIVIVELGNELSIMDYESIIKYQKIVLENITVERLEIEERLVIV